MTIPETRKLFKGAFALLLAVLIGGFIWLAVEIRLNSEQLEKRFLHIIESTILRHAEILRKQLFPRTSLRKPLYRYLKQHPEIRKQCDEKLALLFDDNIRYVYLLRLDPEGKFRFLCDGSDEKSRFNRKFDPDDPEKWRRIYNDGKTALIDQSHYRGLWKSLLYPMRAPDTNRTEAMLVVDYSTEFLSSLRSVTAPVSRLLDTIFFIIVVLVLLVLFQLFQLFMVRRRSYRDPLTGIYNRSLIPWLRKTVVWKNYHLLMVDLDHFKLINDTYGHNVGDRVLIHTTRQIGLLLGKHDYFIRYGGEEFLILSHTQRSSDGLNLAQRIMKRLVEHPYRDPNYGEIDIRVSIGLYRNIPSDTPLETLLKRVDLALYKAKKSGRNRIIEFSQEALELPIVTGETPPDFIRIKSWIEGGGVRCHYQPIHDRRSGEIVKYETLVRLLDDSGRLREPREFLREIWRTNTYLRLTQQVLRNALETFRGKRIPFSVNLSLQDLWDEKVLGDLEELARTYPETIRYLQIEILEYDRFEDLETLRRSLQKIKALGVSIVLDDFGSGQTDILLLGQLPIDGFKIDRTIVAEAVRNDRIRELIHFLGLYARKIGITCTAEYVADESIYRMLKEMPVDYLQGFYLSFPEPAEELFPFNGSSEDP
jgi:diguanylate cyclase (GGDEF)-like protein